MRASASKKHYAQAFQAKLFKRWWKKSMGHRW